MKLIIRWRKKVILGVFSLFIVDIAQLVIPLILREIINALTVKKTLIAFLKYSLLIIFISLFVVIFRFFWRHFILGASREIEAYLREKLYNHLISLHPSFFQEKGIGNLMAHLTNDLEAIRMALGIGVVAFFDFLIMLSIGIGIMLFISWKLTLLTMLPLPVLSVIMLYIGPKIHKYFRKVQERFSELTEKVRESVSGIKLIKTFVQEKNDLNDFYSYNMNYLRESINLAFVLSFFQSMIIFVSGLSVLILIIFGGKRVIYGDISLGDFVAFIGYLDLLVWPMMAIGFTFNIFQRGGASMNRILLLLREENKIKNGYIFMQKNKIKGELEVRDLNFKYNGNYVLKNVSFKLSPGKWLGITGKPGSGKSTLLKLIVRLYEPPDNTIFIDGICIKKYDVKSLRENVVLLTQEPFIFSDTIENNVIIGAHNNVEKDNIEECLKLAGLYNEIYEFPEKLRTKIGERGITISGGQRERLALSRIFLKQPLIILLDAGLNSVDYETEKIIFNNIVEKFNNRTLIVVSTRVSILSKCDEVIVLDKGEIIEKGSPSKLIERDGFYRTLYQIQSLYYEIENKT